MEAMDTHIRSVYPLYEYLNNADSDNEWMVAVKYDFFQKLISFHRFKYKARKVFFFFFFLLQYLNNAYPDQTA